MAEAQFTDIVGQTLTKHPGSLAGCSPLPQPPAPLAPEPVQPSAGARTDAAAQHPKLSALPARREALVLKNLRECRYAEHAASALYTQ